MWSQKFTRTTSVVLRFRQRLWMLSCFFCLFFFLLFFKVVLWTHRPFFQKSWTTFSKKKFPIFFVLFSTLKSKMSQNMCKLRHKVCNGQNLPHGSPNFKHFQSEFSNKNLAFYLRLSKTYSLNPSMKNTLGLYVFEA